MKAKAILYLIFLGVFFTIAKADVKPTKLTTKSTATKVSVENDSSLYQDPAKYSDDTLVFEDFEPSADMETNPDSTPKPLENIIDGCVGMYISKPQIEDDNTPALDTPATEKTMPIASFKIYPNPSRDVINLDYLPADVHDLYICNTSGQIVKRNTPSNQLAVADLTSGIYFVHFISNNQPFFHKLIKE